MREPSEHLDVHAADARTVRGESGGSRDPPPDIHHREYLVRVALVRQLASRSPHPGLPAPTIRASRAPSQQDAACRRDNEEREPARRRERMLRVDLAPPGGERDGPGEKPEAGAQQDEHRGHP